MRVSPRAGLALVPLVVVLALSACATRDGGYYKSDGPPDDPRVDVAAIPDPVPRQEPPSATGNQPYRALGKMYYPISSAQGYRERGVASWYGKMFHGRRTSSGEPYDMYAMTAAHRTLPLPSYVRVRNVANGRTIVVRVNDRGPFSKNRIIDLSYVAALKLGVVASGTALVEVEAITEESPSQVVGAPVTTAEFTQSRWYVQAGAFASQANALSLRNRLLRAGFTPVLIQPSAAPDATLYRVRVGPLASPQEADQTMVRMNGSLATRPQLVIE